MSEHVYISYSSRDEGFVSELREALEGLGLAVWVDSRDLGGGAKLGEEVERAIESARSFLAVLSPNTVNSPWVRREIRRALEAERTRKEKGYRVVPLLLPGLEPSALALWFDDEPVAVRVEVKAGGVAEALPDILAALGERLPEDRQQHRDVGARPFEELLLVLTDGEMRLVDGQRRVTATAQLLYQPADRDARMVESRRYRFAAPLGVIEAEELRWYLESYQLWPTGIFRERARQIESQLPRWGQDLYAQVLAPTAAQNVLSAWLSAGGDVERRFSIQVDDEPEEGSGAAEQQEAREAAAALLSLPWELMHDGRGYLFQGSQPVLVRRRLPARHPQRVPAARLPIRILLVSPRPAFEGGPPPDHRVSALPLVEALERLGSLATLTILTPPTFPALGQALAQAEDAGDQFDVVHLDCHGAFDVARGESVLFFEDPKDVEQLDGRRASLVGAEQLSKLVRHYNTPLVFLDAPQSAKSKAAPTASIAATLLEEGVTSIVAMSHGVLVETARRFVGAFYRELAAGGRVGAAMLAGQRELHTDSYRGRRPGAGELRLQDWFVPVLYQAEQDPQLITKLPPSQVQDLQARQRRLSLGDLPDPPPHEFQGRSGELLALERLLYNSPYAVVRGPGGTGKTTLAVELARWLVRVGRFRRAAFVSFEQYTDARGLLDSLGRQLLLEGDSYSVASYADLKQALLPIERALRDRPTVVVLDNLESVLPDHAGRQLLGAAPVREIFDICRKLLDSDPSTRIVFTTREPLPAPFNNRQREVVLGALTVEDAIKLVGEVMKRQGLTPKADDLGGDPKEITDLVESVDRHARALVLLAIEVARSGVRATAENVQRMMADLHVRHPDDRENSLYASVELSLRRLSPKAREQARALGVFHGGAQIAVLGQVLGLGEEELEAALVALARELIEVGLAMDMGYGHMRLDPALPPYLLREMSEAERERTTERWAGAVAGLTSFLYEQQFEDAEMSRRLTRLELPNLMAALEWAQGHAAPEHVVSFALNVESLLSRLDYPEALARAESVRQAASQTLGPWSRARFLSECAGVERLERQGIPATAVSMAADLLKRAVEAGEEAYEGADYDIALAFRTCGRLVGAAGDAASGSELLIEARRRFEALAGKGVEGAERMFAVATVEYADSLLDLGRLDEAATAYEQVAARAEKLGDVRLLAVNRGQLGRVRMLQRRYPEALECYQEARRIFETLGEPSSVAVTWHQAGALFAEAGQYEQAEDAFRRSLATYVRLNDIAGEAGSLHALGSLYTHMGRLEEAVRCYRQAADMSVRSKNVHAEGSVRNNLAIVLMRLQQYDEARQELLAAVKCKETYGHAAQPWKTWAVLQALEQMTGNHEASQRARERAVQSYLQYRRDGGQPQSQAASLCAYVSDALKPGDTAASEQLVSQIQMMSEEPRLKNVAGKLLSVIRGERSPALADDLDLDYAEAVELQLLLEKLRK